MKLGYRPIYIYLRGLLFLNFHRATLIWITQKESYQQTLEKIKNNGEHEKRVELNQECYRLIYIGWLIYIFRAFWLNIFFFFFFCFFHKTLILKLYLSNTQSLIQKESMGPSVFELWNKCIFTFVANFISNSGRWRLLAILVSDAKMFKLKFCFSNLLLDQLLWVRKNLVERRRYLDPINWTMIATNNNQFTRYINWNVAMH